MLSVALGLSTIMIGTIELSQNFALAQNTTSITPAPELSSSDGDDSSSSEDNDNENDEEGNNESTTSSGSDTNEGYSNDGDSKDTQDTTSSEEEEEDRTEDDSGQTNPLLEEIRNRVNGALSATGMLGPGF